ncbi:MAG TPA: glycosyltransferase [Casimicrobiaceae bacterium]|nr:glycosyltransferase [Casimicrobiaceae bacterium]
MLYAPASGGVARYLQEKREWLRRHTAIRHTLLVPGPVSGAGDRGETYLRTWWVGSGGYRWPMGVARWTRVMRAKRPDLIEIGDPGPIGWAALRAARTLDVPLIAFCHSDVVRIAAERLHRSAAVAVRHYVRLLYRRCDLVIVPSMYMRDRLQRWGISRIAVRPLGVDLRTFSPHARDAAWRRDMGLARNARVLVYAGRFAPEKNLHILLRAFGKLGSPYHLVLVGSGASLPAQSNVTVVPFMESSTSLARVLASADGLVHAGDQETFGLIYLEAMACGRGVIAARAGAAPEIVAPGTGVLVRPRDADALADGIEAFYGQDPEALGEHARAHAQAAYGWDSTMRGLLTIYGDAHRAETGDLRRYATS